MSRSRRAGGARSHDGRESGASLAQILERAPDQLVVELVGQPREIRIGLLAQIAHEPRSRLVDPQRLFDDLIGGRIVLRVPVARHEHLLTP